MNYPRELAAVGQQAGQARAALRAAEETRDYTIRQASMHGRMTVRDIAGHLSMSHQRVAQIIGPTAVDKPTLHWAMTKILTENGGDWMPAHKIAKAIWERNLYQRRDRHPLPPAQVRARAAQYPDLFDTSSDGSGEIRLHRGE